MVDTESGNQHETGSKHYDRALDPEVRCDLLLQNVMWLSADYMVLCLRDRTAHEVMF